MRLGRIGGEQAGRGEGFVVWWAIGTATRQLSVGVVEKVVGWEARRERRRKLLEKREQPAVI
jgi:hypothetical protein